MALPPQRIEILKAKLADAREQVRRKAEANEKMKQRISALQAQIEALRRFGIDDRNVDPVSHNTVAAMNEFFDRLGDETPYLHFGKSLRGLIDGHGINLDDTTVLDFGTGPGIVLKAMLTGFSPRRVVGHDFSETALDFARSYYPEAEFSLCDIYIGRDEAFDFVLCSEVLEHLEYPERALATLLRMTRPGGTLLLTVPDGRIDFSRFHINFWSPESWRLFLQRSVGEAELETGTFKVRADARQQHNFAFVRMPPERYAARIL